MGEWILIEKTRACQAAQIKRQRGKEGQGTSLCVMISFSSKGSHPWNSVFSNILPSLLGSELVYPFPLSQSICKEKKKSNPTWHITFQGTRGPIPTSCTQHLSFCEEEQNEDSGKRKWISILIRLALLPPPRKLRL